MTDMESSDGVLDAGQPIEAELVESREQARLTGSETYNVVSDTVGGVNLRVRDNVFQAIAIFICTVLGAAVGALVIQDRLPGALVGVFIGLVVGLFGSGIFLMIYRAVRHIRGKHD